MYFFHIRRFDGGLERDDLGLELTESDLLREADAGARGLLIESIAERTSSSYRRFEVADAGGCLVLVFDFATVLQNIGCAAIASVRAAGQGQTADRSVILVDDVQDPWCGIPSEVALVAQHGARDGGRLAPSVVDVVKLDALAIDDFGSITDVKKVGGHGTPPGFTPVGGDLSSYSTQSKADGS